MEFKALEKWKPNGTAGQNMPCVVSAIEELQAAIIGLEARLEEQKAAIPADGERGVLAALPPSEPEWGAVERELLAGYYGIDFCIKNQSRDRALHKWAKELGGPPQPQQLADKLGALSSGRFYDLRELATVWMISEQKAKAFRYFLTRAKLAEYIHPNKLKILI